MSINSLTLDNPERDSRLLNRDGGAKVHKKTGKTKEEKEALARSQLDTLRKRIASIKNKHPKDLEPHCGVCFRRGVKATITAIEED
jgi:hypothetical protein